MVWADARRIVALVEHPESVMDRATMKHPRDGGGANGAPASIALFETAVPVLITVGCPQPAVVSLLNVSPEAFGKRQAATGINTLGHRSLLKRLRCLAPRSVHSGCGAFAMRELYHLPGERHG